MNPTKKGIRTEHSNPTPGASDVGSNTSNINNPCKDTRVNQGKKKMNLQTKQQQQQQQTTNNNINRSSKNRRVKKKNRLYYKWII